MFLQRLLKPGPAKAAGEKLYADLGASDTPDGRFEVYTLHVLLVLERLRAIGPSAAATAQVYFDTYLGGLDNGLRELAVGDLAVAKTMRKLAEAFYGRGKAFDAALEALPDPAPLHALLTRTVFGGNADGDPTPFARRLLEVRDILAGTPTETLLAGVLPPLEAR